SSDVCSSDLKVTGTRRIVLQMRCSPRIDQNGFDFLSRRSSGRSLGISYLPIRKNRLTVPIRADESSGRYVRRSRSRKSKMLWRAGVVPVLNEDQATGETDGNVVFRRR